MLYRYEKLIQNISLFKAGYSLVISLLILPPLALLVTLCLQGF